MAASIPLAGEARAAAATTAGTETAAKPARFPAARVQPLDIQKMDLPVSDTWMPLIARLAKDDIPMEYLRIMFGRMGDSYSHEPMGAKINELFTGKFVPRPPRPASAPKSVTPPIYRSMVTPESVAKCKAYLETHREAFAAMEARYGIPKEIVASLLMVETRLGTFLGYNSSFWSLACMAAADQPHRVEATVRALPLPMTPDKEAWLRKILNERSAWAYKELLALTRHSMANGLDPLGMPGSVYGAIGICQFMPSNLPKYAVDGNKDGRIDLFDPADAICSVGNYLKEHGWKGQDWRKKDRDNHHASLKRYNKSNIYANTILALADAISPPPKTAVAGAAKTGSKASKSGAVKSGAKKGSKTSATGKGTGQAKARDAKKQGGQKKSGAAARSTAGTAKKPVQTQKSQARSTAGTTAKENSAKSPAELSGKPPMQTEPAGQTPPVLSAPPPGQETPAGLAAPASSAPAVFVNTLP